MGYGSRLRFTLVFWLAVNLDEVSGGHRKVDFLWKIARKNVGETDGRKEIRPRLDVGYRVQERINRILVLSRRADHRTNKLIRPGVQRPSCCCIEKFRDSLVEHEIRGD